MIFGGENMNIATMREKAGLTQTDLAKKLGVHQTTVSKWEAADIYPTGSLIPKIAEILNCSTDDLFKKDDRDNI